MGRSESNRGSLLRCGVDGSESMTQRSNHRHRLPQPIQPQCEVVRLLQGEDAAGLSGCGSQQQESGLRVETEPLDRLRLLQQQDRRGGIAGIAEAASPLLV